jgi:hypothetical protein
MHARTKSLASLGMTKGRALLLSEISNQKGYAWWNHAFCVYHARMRHSLRFLWNATKGHRLAPWRSPYLLWRIETYCGVKMTQIGFLEFWEFLWRERTSLWRFLKWTAEMERYAHPKPKSP